MNIEERFSFEICEKMRDSIEDADGNEVFFVGLLNEAGLVCKVAVCARGDESSVPVILAACQEWDVLIHNHPSGFLKPSGPDLAIASKMGNDGFGFYIIDNEVTSVYVVVEPIVAPKIEQLKCDKIAALLDKDGPLAQKSSTYEARSTQIQLTAQIAKIFNSSGLGVFEAGTGVGKSFSYLLPALAWAKTNKRRVVISTGTINLQHQLIDKDIPVALDISGLKAKVVLLKGRQNYICLRRLTDACAEHDLFEENQQELENLKSWSENSLTGEKTELTVMPSLNVWSRVCSESDACMGMRCPFREKCFVMKVRKDASTADIIVVNHHLLFSDIQARNNGTSFNDTAVLPPFHHLIFDEAHGIESAATSFFSETLTSIKILKQMRVLLRQKGSGKGLLVSSDSKYSGPIAGTILSLTALTTEADRTKEVIALTQEVQDALDKLESEAQQLLINDYVWRLSPKTSMLAQGLFVAFSELQQKLASYTGIFREILDTISDADSEQSCVWETKPVLSRLEAMGIICQFFLEWEEHYDSVFWIERAKTSQGNFYFRFVITPLSVAPQMSSGVFEPLDSVVCLSATLKTAKSFEYWMHRSGVRLQEPKRIKTGDFPSPFPYDKSVLLAIPVDAPPPDSKDFQGYIQTTIVSLLQASNGRALVLFTSYESLKLCCEYARKELQPYGFNIYRQGEDERSRLLENFKNDTSSILFATDSFWEGVDVPGESLSHVIIVKLPFKVPNDPVQAARTEAITARGGNSFMELSVPDAIVRFKQGFGRLMRRKTDRGVVTVLDNRIITRRYGSLFLESLPETKKSFKPMFEILSNIEDFLS